MTSKTKQMLSMKAEKITADGKKQRVIKTDAKKPVTNPQDDTVKCTYENFLDDSFTRTEKRTMTEDEMKRFWSKQFKTENTIKNHYQVSRDDDVALPTKTYRDEITIDFSDTFEASIDRCNYVLSHWDDFNDDELAKELEKISTVITRSMLKKNRTGATGDVMTILLNQLNVSLSQEYSRRYASMHAYDFGENLDGQYVRIIDDENSETVLKTNRETSYLDGMDIMHDVVVKLIELHNAGVKDLRDDVTIKKLSKTVFDAWDDIPEDMLYTESKREGVKALYNASRSAVYHNSLVRGKESHKNYVYIEYTFDGDGMTDEKIYRRFNNSDFNWCVKTDADDEIMAVYDVTDNGLIDDGLNITDDVISSREYLENMLAKYGCTEIEISRTIDHLVYKNSYGAIAKKEHVDKSSVRDSLNRVMNKANKYYLTTDDNVRRYRYFDLVKRASAYKKHNPSIGTDIDVYKSITSKSRKDARMVNGYGYTPYWKYSTYVAMSSSHQRYGNVYSRWTYENTILLTDTDRNVKHASINAYQPVKVTGDVVDMKHASVTRRESFPYWYMLYGDAYQYIKDDDGYIIEIISNEPLTVGKRKEDSICIDLYDKNGTVIGYKKFK